jgi:hypothetical protein
MADATHISSEAETRAHFLIASEARQSSVAYAYSGLRRRPKEICAPRNDGTMLSSVLDYKGAMI